MQIVTKCTISRIFSNFKKKKRYSLVEKCDTKEAVKRTSTKTLSQNYW